MRKLRRLLASAAALTIAGLAGGAHAIGIAPVLGPAVVGGSIGFGSGAFPVTVAAPGTQVYNQIVYYNGGFIDLGSGTMSATLGTDPAVLLTATPTAGYGHADGNLQMQYQVEYFDPGAPVGTTVAVTVDATDGITPGQVGVSATSATMVVSGPTPIDLYVGYNCSSGLGAGFCTSPIAGEPNTTFTNKTANMVVNTPYTVYLSLQTYAFSPTTQAQASIDPTFSAPPSAGGAFIFSPGVTSGATSGVPEPGTWALMLVGFSGAGIALRGSRRRPAASAI